MGFRRADGRVGTRNFVLIVPTSMCASHEAQQISIISEYTLWTRQKFPTEAEYYNAYGELLMNILTKAMTRSKFPSW